MKSTEIFVFRQDRTDQMTVKERKITQSVEFLFSIWVTGSPVVRSKGQIEMVNQLSIGSGLLAVKWLRLLNFRIDDISY